MEVSDRYFTLEEAQDLVDWLQETFDAIEPLKQQLAQAKERVQELTVNMQSNGGTETQDQLDQAHQELQGAEDGIDEHTYAIVERGIILRGVEHALVDFPAMRGGRKVYLCWLVGEKEISQWHEVDAGFDGRQPL